MVVFRFDEKKKGSDMKRNRCISLLKMIASCGVVFIHVPFPGLFGDIMKYTASFAVPFFYMIAGYFSYGNSCQKIHKKLNNIIKLLLLSYISFFVFNLALAINKHALNEFISNNFSIKTPIYYLIFCYVSFDGPLWYLIAMAEVYIFWYFLVKYEVEMKMLKTTWILLIFGALLTTFVESKGMNWYFAISFLFRALPWFMLGYYFKLKNEYYTHLDILLLTVMAFIGWIITISPIVLKTQINYWYFGVLLTPVSLFIMALKYPSLTVNNTIEYIGEKLSPYIYIYISSNYRSNSFCVCKTYVIFG